MFIHSYSFIFNKLITDFATFVRFVFNVLVGTLFPFTINAAAFVFSPL
ncbi:hypothetical protein QW3_1900 [Clostridioides difficile P74]|nr:hypothetical protein QUY_0471 [Clostridioides difficile P71]EQK32135.1 hypothetical protein QW3_1900 [Clostridioides difficile P74]